MNDTLNKKPVFWRDGDMPHVELRTIEDGREVHYGSHAHKEWSIGAITRGRSTYVNAENQYTVDAGTLVMMNPGQLHACNPIDGQAWAYHMLYIDVDWLTELRVDLGLLREPHWRDMPTAVLKDARSYALLVELCETLHSPTCELLWKQSELITTLSSILPRVSSEPDDGAKTAQIESPHMQAVARHIDLHFAENVSLDELCRIADCSSGHLIRQFRKHYAFSPHAYLVNRRIQSAQQALRNGESIAEAALNAGFADQAHLQRAFKRHLAATPGQYSRAGTVAR